MMTGFPSTFALLMVALVSSMKLQDLVEQSNLNGMRVVKCNSMEIKIHEPTKSFRIPVCELRERNGNLTNGEALLVNLDNIQFESIAESQKIPRECLVLLRDKIDRMTISEIKLDSEIRGGSVLRRLAESVAPYVGIFGLRGSVKDPIDKWLLLHNVMEGIVSGTSVFNVYCQFEHSKNLMEKSNSSLEMQRVFQEHLQSMTVRQLFQFKFSVKELFAVAHRIMGGGFKAMQCLMSISGSVACDHGKRQIVMSIMDLFLETLTDAPAAQSFGTS